MKDPYEHGYSVKIEPVKKSEGDFVAGAIWCIAILALIGWLFG